MLSQEKEYEEQRLAKEKYNKTPKGQMDSIALLVAELKVCEEYSYVNSRDVNTASKKIQDLTQKNLGMSFDKKYFNHSTNE